MGELDHQKAGLMAAPFDLVAGRYRVIAQMGAGGMATVFRAEDVTTGRSVALKVLRSEIGQNPEAAERLRREAEILGHLRHPAIVAIERSGTLSNGQVFLCMELLEGETLGDRMRRGRMEMRELAPIVAGAAAGLTAAHAKGVIHRDLKPDNIFLAQGPFGAPMQVKLLDFGISKVIGFDKITRTGQVLGTPRYMAPEQLMADGDLDARVDVYGLGTILYEALAGQPPFPATEPSALIVSILNGGAVPLRSLRPDLSPEVEAFIARAMARSPEARYPSAPELATAFLELPECATSHDADRAGKPTRILGGVEATVPAGTERAAIAAGLAEPLKPGTFSAPIAARWPVLTSGAPPDFERSAAPTPGGTMARPSLPEPALPPYEPVETPHEVTSIRGERAPRGRSPVARMILFAGAVLSLFVLTSGAALWSLFGETPAPSAARPRPTGRPAPAMNAPRGAERRARQADVPDVIVGAAPAFGGMTDVEPTPTSTVHVPVVGRHAPGDPTDLTKRRARATGSRRGRARQRTASPSSDEALPLVEDPPPPPFVYEAPAMETPAEETPSDLLRIARQQLQSGDARACVSTTSRAIDLGGGAAAYLLEGDCYTQLGDSERAGKAYERFCRAMPAHPAVVRVIPVVESTGGRCD